MRYDLAAHRKEAGLSSVELVSLEQLYPFPKDALAAVIARSPKAELVWW